jgi:hypothetical protein
VHVVSESGFSPLFLVVRALLRYVLISRGIVAFRVVLLFSPLFACAISLLFFLILEQVPPVNSPPESGELVTLNAVIWANVAFLTKDDGAENPGRSGRVTCCFGGVRLPGFGPPLLRRDAGRAGAVVERVQGVGSVGFLGLRIGACIFDIYFLRLPRRSVRGRETAVGVLAGCGGDFWPPGGVGIA